MIWIRAVILSFSTYTRIPMPQMKWDDGAMRFAISFLPLVGAVIGVTVWLWQILCGVLGFSAVLFAAVSTALPIIITGGIHMDGYCDTSDALASCQDKERKLEIMKDPHVGAFALIRCCIYLLVCFGLFYELYASNITSGIVWLFPLSRCFAAWSAMIMPNARKDGMLAAFTGKADRRRAGVILALLTVFAAAGWIWFTDLRGIVGLALCVLITVWYRSMAIKRFGGVTGDTTGFYLQINELALLAGLLLGGVVINWI